MSWVEVQFLHQAVETLQQSRQILMFTYVFAFYLQRSNPTEIFETNQVGLRVIRTTFDFKISLNRVRHYLVTFIKLSRLKQVKTFSLIFSKKNE